MGSIDNSVHGLGLLFLNFGCGGIQVVFGCGPLKVVS